MIAIHNSKTGFHPRWVNYCKTNDIPYKLVDCHKTDIINQLKNCKALLWHFNYNIPKDIVVAKQILFALEHSGFKVFPDFKTCWHFDDKVAQKYLLEKLDLPMVKSFVFLDKKEAVDWVQNTTFPKVFKLRGGAGSANVKLAKNKSQALKLINKAFGSGFRQYDKWQNLKDRISKYKSGKTNLFDVFKGVVRLFVEPTYSKVYGTEVGYAYFQEFIPDQKSDTRIIIIGDRAFALKRMVRKGDFRASGSGEFYYDKELFDERCIELAFKANEKIKSKSIAFDFVFDENNEPLIVEISYGFIEYVYDPCPGYWDNKLNWYEGSFDPYGWMIEEILNSLQ